MRVLVVVVRVPHCPLIPCFGDLGRLEYQPSKIQDRLHAALRRTAFVYSELIIDDKEASWPFAGKKKRGHG